MFWEPLYLFLVFFYEVGIYVVAIDTFIVAVVMWITRNTQNSPER